MKKRLKVAMAFTACLVLLGLVILTSFVLLSQGPHASLVTREQYDLINVGMTEADLETTLGPPRNECRAPVTIWAPQGDGKIVSAEVAPGTPNVRFFPNNGIDEPSREIVWVSKSGLIAASIGQNGRVRDKYFSVVHDPGRPSAMDWIRSRPEELRRVVNK
jgi:hypothetical protein